MKHQGQPLLLITKLILSFVAINAWAGATALLGFPATLGPRFFWPIQPPINAALLGALYLSGATAVSYVVWRNRWESARVFIPVLTVAGLLISLITLWHRDKFDLTWRYHYWLVVYAEAPFLAIVLYWLQERRGTRWQVITPLKPQALYLATATGILLTGVGLGIILLPHPLLTLWPWSIAPLMLRIFAAWFTAFGVGLLWFPVEQDWERLRLLSTLMIGSAGADLVVLLLHRHDVTTTGPVPWIFAGHLLLFMLVGGALHLLHWPLGSLRMILRSRKNYRHSESLS